VRAAIRLEVPVFQAIVPLIHVASVPHSVAFYQSLGFHATTVFTPPDQDEPSFARVDSGGARLMLVRGHAIKPDEQGMILTLYCDDVAATHAALRATGVRVGDLTFPPERPGGRFGLTDPDGYGLAVTHV
jgi:Uncharacterized protein conserved in bacteria